MKRFLSMLISFVLICSFSLNVFAQDGSSSGYLTIPQYNEKYSAQTDGFLSLQEYNNKYSHGESPIIGNEVPNSQNVAPFRISPVKEQTKDIITNESGSKVGTITLQYQTEIQGGRPQFLYDKCYLKPNVTTYWSIDESHSEFSGDRIAVYFTFTYWGQFYEMAVVYFYPD